MTTAAALVTEARRWLGTPYHLHACVRGAGVDCLLLLAGIAQACAILPAGRLPWPAARLPLPVLLQQSGLVTPCALDALTLGDIVGFQWPPRPLQHVGLVSALAPRRMIHALHPWGVVEVGLVGMWQHGLVAAWRWVGLADDAGGTP